MMLLLIVVVSIFSLLAVCDQQTKLGVLFVFSIVLVMERVFGFLLNDPRENELKELEKEEQGGFVKFGGFEKPSAIGKDGWAHK